MGRGRKPTRGGRRQFTDIATLQQQSRELNRRRNQDDDESDEEEQQGEQDTRGGVTINRQGAVGELPPSDSESDESEEEGNDKKKTQPQGNVMQQRNKKINDLTLESLDINDERRGLNRKEREEVARQEAKKRYQALTAAGKTDEAKADLARLAIIRQQREEAAKKRELERKAKEEAAKAKAEARSKAQGRKV